MTDLQPFECRRCGASRSEAAADGLLRAAVLLLPLYALALGERG